MAGCAAFSPPKPKPRGKGKRSGRGLESLEHRRMKRSSEIPLPGRREWKASSRLWEKGVGCVLLVLRCWQAFTSSFAQEFEPSAQLLHESRTQILNSASNGLFWLVLCIRQYLAMKAGKGHPIFLQVSPLWITTTFQARKAWKPVVV